MINLPMLISVVKKGLRVLETAEEKREREEKEAREAFAIKVVVLTVLITGAVLALLFPIIGKMRL